jgi:pyridinium-3,5-biscarboxylic acid mononucleotide synthase
VTAAQLEALLAEVAAGRLTPGAALERLRHLPFEDLPFARIDHHRALRQGQPEVVFCERKTVDQVVAICERLAEVNGGFLATRATEEQAAALTACYERAEWNRLARTVFLPPHPSARDEPPASGQAHSPAAGGSSHAETAPPRAGTIRTGTILVVSAGTSDLPVAEEAVVVAQAFGHCVERLVDVGVAGLHRLLAASEQLRRADVVIVVAGMEGALPSVVGGLVSAPVIAVPTSVGYGASFGGLAALLAMLNSCAAGVTVVNIDNGFGAAAAASRICRS